MNDTNVKITSDIEQFDHIELAEVIDAVSLQEMMNDYYKLTGIGIGIIDLKGNVLVGCGWQDVCVNFHRKNLESCAYCQESDTLLSSGVEPGTFREYRCKNNMWDIATPIMLGGRHIGNIFLGQFFYDDEELDYELYRCQAKRFGYDVQAYLQAIDAVPRYSRQKVQTAMSFYARLARTISESNYNVVLLRETIRKKSEYQKQLENKNSELERFNYTVSHDLRGPLITIKGFAGSLEHDLETGRYDRMTRDMKRICIAADTMDQLLNDLLLLSRVGRDMQSPVSVDMNVLLSRVLVTLAESISGADAMVTVHPALPPVTAYPVPLQEALQNLVENSLKYRQTDRRLVIEIGCRCDEHGTTVYFVKDNGIGVEDKYQQTVFGLFNKLDAKSQGTGIGLALVKKIIELHNGSVWVESDGAGHGSSFCFTMGLPAGLQGGGA